jgi:hypothetical protein
MIKLATVNKALAARGHANVELVRGDGYFYFIGEDADQFYTSSVYVYRLNQLTLDQWIADYEDKLSEYRAS